MLISSILDNGGASEVIALANSSKIGFTASASISTPLEVLIM